MTDYERAKVAASEAIERDDSLAQKVAGESGSPLLHKRLAEILVDAGDGDRASIRLAVIDRDGREIKLGPYPSKLDFEAPPVQRWVPNEWREASYDEWWSVGPMHDYRIVDQETGAELELQRALPQSFEIRAAGAQVSTGIWR